MEFILEEVDVKDEHGTQEEGDDSVPPPRQIISDRKFVVKLESMENLPSEKEFQIKPLGSSIIENIDDTAIDVEIKEEIGDLFMGRSIDDENGTVFPNGLILIHDQPAQMTTASDSRPERHVLTYTPLYMDEKGYPSYLQISNPRSSIIRTQHSQVQFVQQGIQRTKSENNTTNVEKKQNSHTEETNSGNSRTGYLKIPKLGLFNNGFLAAGKIVNTNVKGRKRNVSFTVSSSNPTTNSGSKDPLAISPPTAETKRATNVNITKHFLCTLCGMNFCTFAQRNHHVLQVHGHNLCSHTSQKMCNVGLCNVNICIPTNQHLVEVHRKKALSSSSHDAKLCGIESESEASDPLAISPTKPKGIVQGHVECNLSVIQVESILNIPPMEKRYKCTLCDLKFHDNEERNDHIIAVHEERETSENYARRWHPPLSGIPPDQETREERKRRRNTESHRRYRERQRQSETPEQRTARLAAVAERRRLAREARN